MPHEGWYAIKQRNQIEVVYDISDYFETRANLLSFLIRCGIRPYEWSTQWDSNSLVKVFSCNHYTIWGALYKLVGNRYKYCLLLEYIKEVRSYSSIF